MSRLQLFATLGLLLALSSSCAKEEPEHVQVGDRADSPSGEPGQQTASNSGGWVSSGGELFKDAKNPWFVRNTEKVRYCIAVDEKSVSASPRVARDLVNKAISYWHAEFHKPVLRPANGNVDLATQVFEEVPCTPDVDLAFKFGYGTLDTDEIRYLKDPAKYIGVAVRTSYDEEQLRGRGFIYISSDLGPHVYANSGPLIDRAWTHPELLYYALLHELGHIFGLPHTGSGLMSEVFLDQILNQAIYEIFVESPVEPFFFPDAQLESCNLEGADRDWFGVTQDYECIGLSTSATQTETPVLGRKRGSTSWEPIGKVSGINLDIFDIRNRPAIYLHLNPKQKVFSGQEAVFRSFMIGGTFYDFGAEAVYTAASNAGAPPAIPKSIALRVTSSSFQILGQYKGKVRKVFNYSSLIGSKLFIHPK